MLHKENSWVDLIGAPFAYNGQGPAYDCRTLAKEVLVRMGKEIPDEVFEIEEDALKADSRDRAERIERRIAEEEPKWKRVEKPEVGDLVTLMIHPPIVSHLGVMVARGRFIHIMAKSRVVTSRIADPMWAKRIAGFYRWEGNGTFA